MEIIIAALLTYFVLNSHKNIVPVTTSQRPVLQSPSYGNMSQGIYHESQPKISTPNTGHFVGSVSTPSHGTGERNADGSQVNKCNIGFNHVGNYPDNSGMGDGGKSHNGGGHIAYKAHV